MFGILTIEKGKPAGLWEAIRVRRCRRAAIQGEAGTVGMTGFLKVSLTLPPRAGDRFARRRIEQCMSLMRLRGVHRAVVPRQAEEEALRAGIAPIRQKPALQACAADACLLALQAVGVQPEEAGVTLIADRAGRDVQTAAFELARRVRYVRVASRVPAPILTRRLYEDYGIAEQVLQADGADAALVFDRPQTLPGNYRVLCSLTDEPLEAEGSTCSFQLSCAPEILAQKPPGVPRGDFVAALYLCGGLTRGELTLLVDPESGLDRADCQPYNRD